VKAAGILVPSECRKSNGNVQQGKDVATKKPLLQTIFITKYIIVTFFRVHY
jgi:hypothetical protein